MKQQQPFLQMLCPVLCRQSQRIKQLTLVNKTKGLGNRQPLCNPMQSNSNYTHLFVYLKRIVPVKLRMGL